MTSEPIICYGWKIYYHPLFSAQRDDYIKEIDRLKIRLSESEFNQHQKVKFYKKLTSIIEYRIPINPLANNFKLGNDLQDYCRHKWDRYRLFFKVFEPEKAIFILWLGLRKDGDKKDAYAIFTKRVLAGFFVESFGELLKECHPETEEPG